MLKHLLAALILSGLILYGSPLHTQELRAQDKPPEKDAAAGRTPATNKPVVDPRPSRSTAKSKGDITFDDLKFEIEKGGKFQSDMLTKEIKALDKQTIKLRGYILPNSVYKSSGIENFVLVRDNMECCFGPGAAIYDCVMVYMERARPPNSPPSRSRSKANSKSKSSNPRRNLGGHLQDHSQRSQVKRQMLSWAITRPTVNRW